MVFVHLILALIIMVAMIIFLPSVVIAGLPATNKKNILMNVFFNLNTLLLVGMFAFIPAVVHTVIDKAVWLVSYLFKFKYKSFMHSEIGTDIIAIYLLLSFLIVVIASSIHYNKLSNEK